MFLFFKITWSGGNSSQDYIHKSGNYSITTEGYFQIIRIWNDIIYDKKYRNLPFKFLHLYVYLKLFPNITF